MFFALNREKLQKKHKSYHKKVKTHRLIVKVSSITNPAMALCRDVNSAYSKSQMKLKFTTLLV
jgi:hypothetical protein